MTLSYKKKASDRAGQFSAFFGWMKPYPLALGARGSCAINKLFVFMSFPDTFFQPTRTTQLIYIKTSNNMDCFSVLFWIIFFSFLDNGNSNENLCG